MIEYDFGLLEYSSLVSCYQEALYDMVIHLESSVAFLDVLHFLAVLGGRLPSDPSESQD